MIPNEHSIEAGMVVRHDDGLHYRVENFADRTDSYETAQ